MMGKLSDIETAQFVRSNHIARLGCTDGTMPYVVPVSYLYFDNYFLCYSLDGLKLDMMRKNPHVCMEIDEIADTNNWKCVVAFGRYEEITDAAGIAEAENYFSETTIRLKAEETSPPPDATRPGDRPAANPKELHYYYIHIEDISGRFEKR